MSPTLLRFGALGCLVLLLAAPIRAQQIPALSKYLEALNAQGRFTGHVLVTRVQRDPSNHTVTGSMTVHSAGVGSLDDRGAHRFSDTTRFLIGSVTKPLIACVIRELVAQGRLDTSSTIDRWFPFFPHAKEITVQHLLDHRSGIADYKDIPNWEVYAEGDPSPMETIRLMADHVPLMTPPGESFRYSNVGYIMLGVIIERVTTTSVRYTVNRLITDRLSLFDTGVPKPPTETLPSQVSALGYRTEGAIRRRAPLPDLDLPFTSGNMISSTNDLNTFIVTELLHGHLPDSADAASWIAARAPYKNGWAMRDFDGVPGIGHYGAMSGYTCSITWLPTKNLVIAFCGNDDHVPYRTITPDVVKGLTTGVYPTVVDESPRTLAENEVAAITGRYRLPSGGEFEVKVERDQLVVQESGQSALLMYPIAGGRFNFAQLERFARFEGLKGATYQTLVLEDLHGTPMVRATRVD